MMKMMGGKNGIFTRSKYRFQYEGAMTESGLVGTIVRLPNGETSTIEGAAEENKNGFILFDEFSALKDAMRQSYNSQLETQLLMALDSGLVNKRLSNGRIEYDTNFTLWGGVQPVRTDLSSGLGRRLCVLLHKTNIQDTDRMITAQFKSLNIKPDEARMERLHARIGFWLDSFNMIRKIEFDPSIERMYKDLGTHHTNVQLYNKLLIGYTLARHGAEKYLTISDDDEEAMRIIKQEESWREDVMNGSDTMQVLDLITQYGVLIDGYYMLSKQQLMKHGHRIHFTLKQMDEKIKELVKMDLLEIKDKIIIYNYSNSNLEDYNEKNRKCRSK